MSEVGASPNLKYYYEEFGCSALSPDEAELFSQMCEQSGGTKKKAAGARAAGEQSTTNTTTASGGQSGLRLEKCTAFADCNFTLWKAGNNSPESFSGKDVKQNVPSQASSRKAYVKTYVGVIRKVKDEVTHKIWMSGAERTDAVGRIRWSRCGVRSSSRSRSRSRSGSGTWRRSRGRAPVDGTARSPHKRKLAERKKNEGNEYYKNKEYREALKLYTQAIDLCPDCAAYYSNRSACYMMLGKYYEALNDAREAVRLDTSFVKGYLRVAKCNIALGDATAALSVLRQAGEIEPNNRAIQEEVTKAQSLIRCQDEVAKATAKADYRTAIFHLDRALELAVGCRSLKITKAEYLVFLQRYGDAQEIVNDILQYDSGNADAIYVRGMCLYYQDNPDAAFSHFQHVLRLAPDHQKARDVYKKAKLLKQKKEEGNEAFKKGNYQEAFNLYTDALAIDPLNKHTNAKLYFNRATVGSKLNKLEQATEDCTAAINLDDGYVKAYLRRAKCYQLLEKHEEAVRDYERITKLDRSQEHKRLLQEAKIQLKRSKRKDYYKILGVNKNASDDEIKKSYRKMALVHHPDRHANASEKDKHEHEIKFKEIGEAYSVLTDAKKRAMYDRGQDINDPDGGFAHEDIDPNQIFQAFFGGGHGGYSFGGHNAGFQQGGFPGTGFTGASFPGGFHFQFG